MTIDKQILIDIGNRIQNIRKELGLLQKQFAEEMDISTSSISEIEMGNAKPRFELLFNISKFNVNPDYLLHGKGPMFKDDDRSVRLEGFTDEWLEWMRKFLYYFENSPMLRHHFMSVFYTYLNQNEKYIDIDIRKNKIEQGEKDES